jgi:two-component system chemotaxis response regulator CheB
LPEPGFHIAEKLQQVELLVIGCSAGGFNLVFNIVTSMPATMPVPVIVIIHRSRKYRSSVEELLGEKAKVQVKIADDKEKLRKGCVYFAPADYHVLIEPEGTVALDASEPVHFCRPAIDVTFQSASDVYGAGTMGMLLSGANEDGADGLAYITRNKGIAVIQDPAVAEVKTMPQAAVRKCRSGMILTNEELFALVGVLAGIRK